MPATTPNPGLRYWYPLRDVRSETLDVDVCVYGGTSCGVAAAVQLARMGRSVALLEFGRHLGGLSAGGLGATDIGNKGAIGGISRAFYRRLGRHYGQEEAWTFEPGVAERAFEAMLAEEGVEPRFERRLAGVTMRDGRIAELRTEDGSVYRAAMFIDASYEGDLLAATGCRFHVGREANRVYDEVYNGVQFGHPNHNLKLFVDPYVVPGRPASGLLPGISAEPLPAEGEGDHRVQAYNFRMCLTDDAAKRTPFPKPAAYDAARYELLRRYLDAGVWDALRLTIRMPGGKTDTNNFGGVSSDHIGANYRWPEGSYAEREAIFQDHVAYLQGLLWFLANDERVPQHVRAEVSRFGLPDDEFPETAGWPHQLYVREARRLIGDYVMTEHDCVGRLRCDDPVGLAAYTMDSHNCSRVVRGGRAINEGNVEIGGFPPYPISYRAIVPARGQCANLLVPWCLSSSHIAFGSIRMEPVGMVLGQSAATAAALALDAGCAVQDVDHARLRRRLLDDGQVLAWTPQLASAHGAQGPGIGLPGKR